MTIEERIFNLLLAIPAIVAGLTVHEFAHAWMGHRLGDDTARSMGRLTLDPLKHLDPLGSLAFVLGALSGFFFGWAKPVPFNPRNLKHPRRDAMLIAVAGPVSNILQVPFWFFALWLAGRILGFEHEENSVADTLMTILSLGIIVNLSLAAFNMIPLPPLDGHYILEGLGPPAVAQFFDMIRPHSFLILILLINLDRLGIMDPDPITLALTPVYFLGEKLILLAQGVNLFW